MMKSRQSGNAILLILIAVFLFGALAAAFMRGARTGQANLTANQAKLVAQEIVTYAQSLERGTIKLIQRGCSETELEYDMTHMTDCGANADTPADGSCRLFAPEGAALSPLNLNERLGSDVVIRVSGGSSLDEIGTWDPGNVYEHQDLVFWVGPIDLNTCRALNSLVGNDAEPVDLDIAGQNWCFNNDLGVGHFGGAIIDLDTMAGKKAACINNTGIPMNEHHVEQGYQFYYAVYER